MYCRKGEVRRIGIEIISQLGQEFIIDSADFSIIKTTGEFVSSGIPTIDGHKLIALFSADEEGQYYCEFKYHIGPEILKAKIYMEVTQ